MPEFWQKIKEDFAKNKTPIYNNNGSTASANPIEIINVTNPRISVNNNNVILTRKTSSAKILLNHNTPNHLIFPGPLRSSPEKKTVDLSELGTNNNNNNNSQPSKFDLDSLARNLASLRQLDQASKMNNNSSSPISDTKDKNQENNNNNLASVADLDLIRNSLASDQRLKQILSLPSGSNVSNQKSEQSQNQNENKTINDNKNKNQDNPNVITNNGTIQPSLRNRLIRKCQYCNKEFDKKWNYDRHMNHEMKLKPHTCEVCARTFTDKGSKKHHIKKSHPDFLNELEIREKQELLQGALASSQINLDDLIKLSKDNGNSNNSAIASTDLKSNNNNNNSSVSLDEILKNCQPKTNYPDKIKVPTTKINSISIPVLNGNLNHNGKNVSQSARSINVSKENTPPQSVQSTQNNKKQIKIVDINKKKIDRIELPTPPDFSSSNSQVQKTTKTTTKPTTTMKSSSLTTGISGNKRSAIVINAKKAQEPVTISSKNVPKIEKVVVEDVIQPLKKRILTAETNKDAMNLTKGARTSRT